jgi:hypothetical protein
VKKSVLALAAVAEAGTGSLLLAWPQVVVCLLFAAEINAGGVIMSRLAGIALGRIGRGLLARQRYPVVVLRDADLQHARHAVP